jgi:predicted metal-dependent hydrolase
MDDFWRGLEEFNSREFYNCHDTLEAIWIESQPPTKLFYQGLIQIAVGLYHLENRNWQGAVTLLRSGIDRLEYFCPRYFGVELTPLLDQSDKLLDQLYDLGPEMIDQVDLSALPTIRYQRFIEGTL